jgi:hypothetical protein
MYIDDVREDEVFSNLSNIGELVQKNGANKEKSMLCIGLSTFKAYVSVVGCYCNCREIVFGREACEDIFV